MKRFLEVKTESGSVYHFSIDEDVENDVSVMRVGKDMGMLIGKFSSIKNNIWYMLEGEFEEPEVGKGMLLHLESTEPISTTNVTEIIDTSEQVNVERFVDP